MDTVTQPLPSLEPARLRAVPPAPELPRADPFLAAWGRALAWRADALAGQRLAHLPRALIDHDPGQALLLARALAHAMALRHYLVEQVDTLLGTLRCPHLHRVLRQMRIAGQGWLPPWRRHNATSALSQCYLVEQEAMTLAHARRQVQDQQVAIEVAGHALEQARLAAGVLERLPEAARQQILADLEAERQGMEVLRAHLDRLLEGIGVLCQKARIYDEMCNAVPNHGGILRSRVFRTLMAQLLTQPRSGLPVCKE